MKKKLAVFVATLTVLALGTGVLLFTQGENGAFRPARHVIVIGVEENYHPFCFTDKTGNLTGFDVEFARALCAEQGWTCRIEPMVFSKLLPSLRSDRLQLVIAGLGETEERKKEFLFSNTYYRSRSFFITSEERLSEVSEEVAPELIIGVQEGSLQKDFVERHFVPLGARMKSYATYTEQLDAILAGEINAVFTDGVPGYAILNSPGGSSLFIGGRPDEWIDDSLTESKIAAKLCDAELIDAVNETLFRMQSTGRYQELNLRFFPFVTF